MNKRGTKGLFGERSSIGRPLFERLCSLSRRSVPSALLLLAFALLPCARVEGAGYRVMDNDRMLLMNNDNKFLARVSSQGYYDTNTTEKTYWVHDTLSPGLLSAALLPGVTHTMYKNDGTRLWHLEECRAGSGTSTLNTRNYIPWTPSAISIKDGSIGIPTTATGVQGVGSVIMRNSADACVYSPLYTEGIGTIYLDAVNAYTNLVTAEIALEIATDVTPGAAAAGKTFEGVVDEYDSLQWRPCPFDVFLVSNSATLTSVKTGVTNLVLDVTSGGSKEFYRVRTQLNHYAPIRFRIRRLNQSGGSLDTSGLVLIDNIIASYPPMTAELRQYGTEYDPSLKGADVLGCLGDFTQPFLANGSMHIFPHAWVNLVTNSAVDVTNPTFALNITNTRMIYRWRYLEQFVGDWKTIAFDQDNISSVSFSTSNLVGKTAIPLTDGVGDIEYYYLAEIDTPYYITQDYACSVGYGAGWTEKISAVTNRATYTGLDGVPTGGTDYFVRIREGESNMEWVQLHGTLTVTNTVGGSNDVYKLLTPDGIEPRMTLVGDHSWRYHYEVPTNAIGGTLSFKIVTKEYYTNETDAATWFIRTNELGTVEKTVSEIPFTATLHPLDGPDVGNTLTNISVVLDDSSTHLKIEYNDEQRAFALSHASYQSFNLWTDARVGFRGNSMETNGTDVVSNSGVSEKKQRYNAPFDSSWELCPQVDDDIWTESFNNTGTFSINVWKNIQDIHGWTARNSMLVWGTRNRAEEDLSLALDGFGQGSVGLENFNEKQLPLGLDTVSFIARIAQPVDEYEAFAVYMYGGTLKNYAISAKVTMSQDYEAVGHYPKDMSPINPSVSLVGYHRESQGCYELRMTRTGDKEVTLGIYKWTEDGSKMKATLLKTEKYTEVLWPTSSSDVSSSKWTTVYFLLYTMSNGKVRLEGHLAPSPTTTPIGTDIINMRTSTIWYVDAAPGILRRGGSYGVGSTDCRAGFGAMKIHTNITAPTDTSDAVLNAASFTAVKRAHLDRTNEDDNDIDNASWDYLPDRWEVANFTAYAVDGCLMGVVPSNQTVQVWLSDASVGGTAWFPSGYERVVNSFTTNKFTVSPRMPGSWKVELRTGEEEASGVVVDNVALTPWEGVETWIGNGRHRDGQVSEYRDKWVYTKGWITATAEITRDGKPYELPKENVISIETDDSSGYAYVFDQPGTYTIEPQSDMEIERVLLVGGGGAGGGVMGGGGGGGGVVEHYWTNDPVVIKAKATILKVTVGAGGTSPTPTASGAATATQPAGNNGGGSSLTGVPGKTIETAKGGGGGGGWSNAPKTGGANGGGGSNAQNGAAGTQGNRGGNAHGGTGGGGGGAGGNGQDAEESPNTVGNTGKGGDGGPGKASDITGKIVYYGGGGGGGAGWVVSQTPGEGGEGGGGRGSDYRAKNAVAGTDGLGGGGGGGTWYGSNGPNNIGANGGCGTVILRMRSKSRVCTFQPSRGKLDKPMGLRSPAIYEGMSLFSYSYKNADSNCVLLVQIATNMLPRQVTSYIDNITENLKTSGGRDSWTTIARHEFKNYTPNQLASGTRTEFISLRQHSIKETDDRMVLTNVCGAIRVIVDPAVVSNVLNTTGIEAREAKVDYGKITLTKAYCYNEPALNLRSWFGFNVHTEGWDGSGNAGRFAFLTDWPDGLSIALNFSSLKADNNSPEALGIGLVDTSESEIQKYAQQNPFIQSAALTNGVGTVSFRARLFDTNTTSAVVTLYGGKDPSMDQPTTQDAFWTPITNFVVTTPTYQAFEWSSKATKSDYKAIRLEAAGARWGRVPGSNAEGWEWGDLQTGKYGAPVQSPINRVFIDEVSASELIVPRLKFLDVRPFREHLGAEDICVITNIMTANQQPLIMESWGIQCRVEPQQMADELDTDSIRVWMEVYRGETPWGYANWASNEVDNVKRFSSELVCVSRSNLVFRSYFTIPESIMKPETSPNTVYQYVVRATYNDKSGSGTEYPAELIAADWVKPEWYRGSSVGAGNDSGDPKQFSAYTILDSISPYRAWINELNLCDAMDMDGLHQFIELAVPQNADLSGWYLKFADYNKRSASLVRIGIDDGVRDITSKTGSNPGVDNTNHYTFVSVCSPSATAYMKGKCDGEWKTMTTNTIVGGVFSYQYPYGIQLLRPSGIVEHEVVVEGTNRYAHVSGAGRSGEDLVEGLKQIESDSTWFFVGRDLVDQNYESGSSIGVWRSHGEEADPSNWTNAMKRTPGEINVLRDGTLQEIPYGYFLLPHGGNVWIYSTLLKPQYMKQYYGGREISPSAVLVVPEGVATNIVVSVTNWYQIGECTTNDVPVPGARGSTGTYKLYFGPVSNETVEIKIDAEPQSDLAEKWGLTPENRYTPAVLDWLLTKYGDGDFGPGDLSTAPHYNLGLRRVMDAENRPVSLSLTEMYWLNIPPVHKSPIFGGSNIWYVAGMGTSSLIGGDQFPVQQEYEKVLQPSGLKITNVFTTVTIMITNTVTGAANPPDRLNGLVYDGEGSLNYTGRPAWTSVVFSITGALQKPDVRSNYYPVQQYVFTPDSFGAKDSAHPFQTRIDVMDPFSPNSMGYYYDWPQYRFIYPRLFWKYTIEDNPDGRVSIVPLKANWTPVP